MDLRFAGVLGVFLSLFLALPGGAASFSSRAATPFPHAARDGYVLVLWGTGYSEAQLGKILDRIAASGSGHLTIPLFGCQADIHSSDVGSCEVASRPYTIHLAKLAIAHGFEVSFLPIVETKKWDWRGEFDPTDVDAWFASYTRWIEGVALDEMRLGMKELVVGTEFSKLYRYEDRWRQLLGTVRHVFTGPLIMTVNWDDLDHGFWDAADAIGISAYYPLSDDADPSQAELDAAWVALRAKLDAVSQKWSRPLHLTEIGYRSMEGAAHVPWQGGPDPVADVALQARCFSAFAAAWAGDSSELARVNVWATGIPDDASAPLGFETLDKPAENVLKDFFAARKAEPVSAARLEAAASHSLPLEGHAYRPLVPAL